MADGEAISDGMISPVVFYEAAYTSCLLHFTTMAWYKLVLEGQLSGNCFAVFEPEIVLF